MYGRQDLIWHGSQLRLFSSRDQAWPGMWRVYLSDGYLNLSRARDAAVSLALGVLNQQREAA
jgi:hypothetical protein